MDREREAETHAGYFHQAASQGCCGIKPSATFQGCNTAYFRLCVLAISCIGMRIGSITTSAGFNWFVKSADQSNNERYCSGSMMARAFNVNSATRPAPLRAGG